MTTILVTGGTGVLGRLVTERLRADGHEVRVLSRHSEPYAVDLVAGGPGLDTAVAGVDTIVHCMTSPRGGDDRATANLIAAARRAGVPHLVYISIVGVDRVPLGYYRSKLAVERMVEESGLGWTILRATQFHEFAEQMLERGRTGPVVVVPKMRSATVAAAEVAAALVDLVESPQPGTVEMGGPEEHDMPDLVRRVARARGLNARVFEVKVPGSAGRAMTDGSLIPTNPWRTGTTTFDAWLRA